MSAPRHCLVVGAGVAGAAIARALADKGWQVDVVDQAASPAAGVSGVPIGVLSCHVSVDDNPLSKLTRDGLLKVRSFSQAHLLKGQDWLDCGVHLSIGLLPRMVKTSLLAIKLVASNSSSRMQRNN